MGDKSSAPDISAPVSITTSQAANQTIALTHGEKPEKFNGSDFKRWQSQMLFWLTTLNLAKFLVEDANCGGQGRQTNTHCI